VLGSPQAEFEIPYGNLAQNCGYAMIAQRYAAELGYDPRATAKIAADQRTNACANPDAVFRDQPISIEDVLASKMVADPLHVLEIVMPCAGGAAVVIASKEAAERGRARLSAGGSGPAGASGGGRAAGAMHRPVYVTGFGENLTHKTPTYMPDLVRTPIGPAADRAFAMAGIAPADVDVVEPYDCYTITVLLTLEDSGFCAKGEGMGFVMAHDLTYRGDFPVNTHGGQLGFGQAGMAGGFSQLIEGVTQVRGEAGARQVPRCDTAYVTGTGGIMSEQAALILHGG
jgi:acetyl-CoA acetyltransferase